MVAWDHELKGFLEETKNELRTQWWWASLTSSVITEMHNKNCNLTTLHLYMAGVSGGGGKMGLGEDMSLLVGK